MQDPHPGNVAPPPNDYVFLLLDKHMHFVLWGNALSIFIDLYDTHFGR
jgi:hypothetical protein